MKTQNNAEWRNTGYEYKLIWTVSFLLFLPTIAVSALLPEKFQLLERESDSGNILSEAIRLTDTYIPMIFRS